jgi:hypothetical protein
LNHQLGCTLKLINIRHTFAESMQLRSWWREAYVHIHDEEEEEEEEEWEFALNGEGAQATWTRETMRTPYHTKPLPRCCWSLCADAVAVVADEGEEEEEDGGEGEGEAADDSVFSSSFFTCERSMPPEESCLGTEHTSLV